jgi:hypothetical protein
LRHRVTAAAQSGGVRVRFAGPSDIHRVAALLPQGLNDPVNTRYLVAERDGSPDVLGGAYFRIGAGPDGAYVASFRLGVVADDLGVEAATRLLTFCLSAAQAAGARAAVYDGMVAGGSPDEALLRWSGFAPTQTLVDYEIDCRAAFAVLESTQRQLRQRGRLPAEAAVVALDDAPSAPVDALLSRYLGGSIRALGECVSPSLSSVARIGRRVVGVIVAMRKDDGVDIPYTVTEPGFRNLWVTPVMWRRTALELIGAGHDTVTYSTNSQQFRSMFNFTRRLGSRETGRQVRYARYLPTR